MKLVFSLHFAELSHEVIKIAVYNLEKIDIIFNADQKMKYATMSIKKKIWKMMPVGYHLKHF